MKTRFLTLMFIVLAGLGLAGCFTSDQPLFTDDQAVAPYAKITFNEAGSPDKTTMVREGKGYVTRTDDGTMTMRFMPVGDDLYLAESTGQMGDETLRLYALVRFDKAQNTAMAYKVMAEESDAGEGLQTCQRQDMDMICVGSADAYVTLAKAKMDSGAEPDSTYTVTLE